MAIFFAILNHHGYLAAVTFPAIFFQTLLPDTLLPLLKDTQPLGRGFGSFSISYAYTANGNDNRSVCN